MAETTNVSKLIINYLTEEQYTTAKASGLINENELYVTDVQDSTTLDCFEELFTATEGQTLFTLTEGTYQIGESRLTVCVNGAQQPSTAYTETGSSSFTFDSGLSVGDSVIARYVNARIISNITLQAHKSSHASAGNDALTPSDIGAATSTHTHGNITNGGAVGSTPNLPIFTGTNGLLETKSIEDTKTLLGIGDSSDTTTTLSEDVKTALALTGTKYVSDALTKLSGVALRKTITTTLANMPDGTEFTLNETISGTTTAITFIKVQSNYQGSGRTLVLRKNTLTSNTQWRASGYNNYAGSDLDYFLNNTYIGYLDASVQSLLANVNVPCLRASTDGTYVTFSSAIDVQARKCFALSCSEVGTGQQYPEGTAIPYFSSDAKRAASATSWLRTPYNTDSGLENRAYQLQSGGGVTYDYITNTKATRPTFTLPADYGSFNPVNGLIDMTGNEFILPYCKIATGSYTGTGTYDSGNPNSLTLAFVPTLLSITYYTIDNLHYAPFSNADGNVLSINCSRLTTSYTRVIQYHASGSYDIYAKKSADGKTIYWYSAESAARQCNTSAATYGHIEIG